MGTFCRTGLVLNQLEVFAFNYAYRLPALKITLLSPGDFSHPTLFVEYSVPL